MNSGIYAIINTVNGKRYIGSTKDFTRRKKDHFRALRKQRHANPKLQNAFNKYGQKAFIFSIIEIIPEDQLLDIEQQHIDANKDGYNIAKIAGRPNNAAIQHTCLYCGLLFMGQAIAKYCSSKCGNKAKYERGTNLTCICKACGKEFHPKESNRTTLCSQECFKGYKREYRPKHRRCSICGALFELTENNRRCSICLQIHGETGRIQTCKICNRQFHSQHGGKICSDECKKKQAGEYMVGRNVKDRQPTTITCRECNKTFTVLYYPKRRLYCSNTCRERAKHKRKGDRG